MIAFYYFYSLPFALLFLAFYKDSYPFAVSSQLFSYIFSVFIIILKPMFLYAD